MKFTVTMYIFCKCTVAVHQYFVYKKYAYQLLISVQLHTKSTYQVVKLPQEAIVTSQVYLEKTNIMIKSMLIFALIHEIGRKFHSLPIQDSIFRSKASNGNQFPTFLLETSLLYYRLDSKHNFYCILMLLFATYTGQILK